MARSPRRILRPHQARPAGLPAKPRCPGSAGRPDAHTIIHHLRGDHHGSSGLLFSKLNNPISYNCLLPNCLVIVLCSFQVQLVFLGVGPAGVPGTGSEQAHGHGSRSVGCVPCPLCWVILGDLPWSGASLERGVFQAVSRALTLLLLPTQKDFPPSQPIRMQARPRDTPSLLRRPVSDCGQGLV